eukprot:GHVQ01001126.1.p1 GENE.GHVQ01001126.1~~GHVQ01001126.1.p1  ORF type:complete len:278 (-),score=23.83 GHVQ01001126.1:907-1740(-)
MRSNAYRYISSGMSNSAGNNVGSPPTSLGPPSLSRSERDGVTNEDDIEADVLSKLFRDLGCSYCCKTLTNTDASTELTVRPGAGNSILPPISKRGRVSPPALCADSRATESSVLPDVPDAVRRPKVTFRDGRTYEGQWRGSMRHGDGRECSKLGDFTYEGQFRVDMYHGFGTMRWSNGSKYIGNFRENKKHGWGHEFYPHGESYQGCFHNGQIDGYGTYYFKDGTTISGQWKDGRLLTSAGCSTPRLTTPSGTPTTTPPRTPNSSPLPSGKLPPTVF